MSIGRVATFLDIYIQRDLDKGIITEEEAQEMIDHLTMKFRMVKIRKNSFLQPVILRRPSMGNA